MIMKGISNHRPRSDRFIIITGFIFVLLLGLPDTLQPAYAVSGGCATPPATYGQAKVTITTIQATPFRIWSRLQAPDTTNNSFFLQVDDECTRVFGDSAIPAGQWTWVNSQDGDTAKVVTISPTIGDHRLTLTGREPGVLLDKVIITPDLNCTPVDEGDNCKNTAQATITPTITPTPATTSAAPTATPTSSAQPTPAKATPGDANQNGTVELSDLNLLLTEWNTGGSTIDFNSDGQINVYDLSILLSHWTP